MKNIYVLPTDKPSRLFIGRAKKELFVFDELANNVPPIGQNQNIYITSDEEIKEGIYTIDLRFNIIVKITTLNIEDCKIGFYDGSLKKIILTTDQDLIADGVQAIPDDFLEWFVENQSCEEVEVIKYEDNNSPILIKDKTFHYKIIIPKEEPKQETLEEAAFNFTANKSIKEIQSRMDFVKGAMFGAKRQSERSYSEEEVEEYLDYYETTVPVTIKQWFEQFKKK